MISRAGRAAGTVAWRQPFLPAVVARRPRTAAPEADDEDVGKAVLVTGPERRVKPGVREVVTVTVIMSGPNLRQPPAAIARSCHPRTMTASAAVPLAPVPRLRVIAGDTSPSRGVEPWPWLIFAARHMGDHTARGCRWIARALALIAPPCCESRSRTLTV